MDVNIEIGAPTFNYDHYDWKKLFSNHFPTGSRYICSPPVMNTDEDWCVFTSLDWDDIDTKLEKLEFYCGGSKQNEGKSYKRWDGINLIVLRSYKSYKLWSVATELAKRFNLTDKEDRIDLFEAVVRQNIFKSYKKKIYGDWM